jgi:RNA polymerase sigma factor (sigma-70 family)
LFELFVVAGRPVYHTPQGAAVLSDKQLLESELLVVRCQRGNRSALEDIVKLWEQPLFYYLRRLAASEADAWELLQDTWLKVIRSIGSLRDGRALPSFLYTTAHNTAISHLRRLGIRDDVCDVENLHDDSAADEVAILDNAEQVHHALDQLPLFQREVLTLFFLQDLSLDQMARLLGVPLGTVKSRLHYAKIAIRQILSRGEQSAIASFEKLNQQSFRKVLAKGIESVQ